MDTVRFLTYMFSGTLFLGVQDMLRRKFLREGMDAAALLATSFLIGGISLLPFLLFIGIPEIKEGFWFAVGATIFLNIFSQNLFFRAFQLSEASLIAPLVLMDGDFSRTLFGRTAVSETSAHCHFRYVRGCGVYRIFRVTNGPEKAFYL